MSRNRIAAVAAVALLTIASSSWGWAQIYKITDKEKGVVFTDRPQSVETNETQQVETLDLQEMNTVPAVEPRPMPEPAPSAKDAAAAAAAPTVTITSPANESTIAMGPGNFAVSAAVTPPLSRGERLVLLMDGQPIGAAQSSASWFIEGALRGPHDLVVQRTTSSGKTIAISEPVRVYVLRPSVLNR